MLSIFFNIEIFLKTIEILKYITNFSLLIFLIKIKLIKKNL